MTSKELLAELQNRGVALEAVGGRLRYDAPKGALTPALRRAMAAHKAELLGLVKQHLRTQATDIVAVAELLVAGQALGWLELAIGPGLSLRAGEDAWTRFLEHPPPGALAAALAVAKARIEEAWPL